MPYARLPERSLLAVTGEPAHHFLQNLVTADLDSLADGEIHLSWGASPAASYTVRSSNSVAGPYTPVGKKLKFDDSTGSFSAKADRAAQFFIIQAK